MEFLLTERGQLLCSHTGPIPTVASQSLVTIDGAAVLVKPDPEGKPVACPRVNVPAGQAPCGSTGSAQGYSELVFIDGRAVCLGRVRGNTLAPDRPEYRVASCGQSLASEDA